MSLHVAVDLRIADRPGMERTGVGRYAVHSTDALCRARPDWRLTLFSNRPELVQAPNAYSRPTRLPTERSSVRVAWQQLVAPWARPAECWVSTAFTLPFALRGPAVVTIHDLVFLDQPETYAAALNRAYAATATRFAARRAARVVCGSQETRDRLRDRLGTDPAKVRVVPYGVQAGFAGPPHRDAAAPFALFVGTHEPRKGLDVLRGALALVNAGRETPLRLVLAGKPGWGDQGAVADLRADPHVRFVLGPSDAELADLYRSATLLVFPSRAEGFGLPVAEAMASELPVVASDLRVLRGFAGDAPRYCAPGDPVSLAAGIRELLDDPGERARRAELGRKAAAGLRWDAVGEALARCVEEAVAAQATRL